MFKQLQYIFKTMRPKQWIKNLFVFAGLVFDQQLFSLESFFTILVAAILFCLTSSLVYIINDLVDIKSDRQHPIKQKRPLASGMLSQRTAIITALLLGLITFSMAFYKDIRLGWIIAGYFVLMLAYSLWLKHVPLIDVMVIAAGFVLRVAAGVIIIQTKRFSPWLFVATVFLSLFLGLGKRRAEIELLTTKASSHRSVLDGYSLELLDQLITIVLSTTLMTYCLYTFSVSTTPGSYRMMLTIPFVIYGLFRYLYLVRIKNSGGAPEDILMSDWPMLATVAFWGISILLILYLP